MDEDNRLLFGLCVLGVIIGALICVAGGVCAYTGWWDPFKFWDVGVACVFAFGAFGIWIKLLER